MLTVGIPAGFQSAQAGAGAKLGKDQGHQMLPACEAFDVGVAIVTLDDRLELATIDGFNQFAEDARREVHAPFLF